jgi:hypothetical protein
MTDVIDQTAVATATETDLVAMIQQVLQGSEEPLTLSKLRAQLPVSLRSTSLEALEETLQRQVAANVLYHYPKYRSPQNRYWDRPMPIHLAYLLRTTLHEKPLSLSELRRKLPDYAKTDAETILDQEVSQGRLHRHPPQSSRSGPRFGARRPDPKDYLDVELSGVFKRLHPLGFKQEELRAAALELLHDEEWAPATEPPAAEAASPPPQPSTAHAPPTTEGQPAGQVFMPDRQAHHPDQYTDL